MAGWGNSFSLLDEDESGEGAVRVPVKAAAPVVAKPAKEEPKTAHKNAAVTDNKESGRKPERQQRPPRAREERGPRDESAEQQQQQGGAASTRNNEGAFNRTRGPNDRSSGERRERRDNGASGAPGAARAPRQFDRRSGTGRGREVQRGGAGRGNWGSDEQEIQEQVKAADPGDASVDNAAVAGSHDADWAAKNDDSWGAAAPAADAATGEQPAKEEKAPRELTEEEKQRQADREAEAKLMTLDEYLEKKKKLDYQLPAPRQAGEGEDSKQWAGFVAAKSDKQAAASDSPASAKKTDEKKVKEAKKVPLPAELLKFKGEQQRRDNERRESRPPRDGAGYERRERREDQPPRAPRANNSNNGPAKQTKQAEFGAQDFPSLKA